MQKFRAALICGVCIQSSCATATRGTHEEVKFFSEPPGATALSNIHKRKPVVFEDGTLSEYVGCAPAPCSFNISRRASPTITMNKPGHHPIKFKMCLHMAIWLIRTPIRVSCGWLATR